MDKRESLIDQFSTFIRWREDRFQKWETDARLQRHMAQQLHSDHQGSSQYWVAYWYQHWQQSEAITLSRDHLYAYLQEPCYRVTAQLWSTYQNHKNLSLADLFSQGVLCFQKLLSNFNPVLNPNLAAYASFFLKWRILDELRRQDKSYGHTRWSLLLHSSPTRMRKALVSMGLTDTLLECHLQAWECYVERYQPVKIKQEGKIQPPPAEIWSQITADYNLVMPHPQDVDYIQKWVDTCGQAVFRYIAPADISINQALSSDGSQELMDVIPTLDSSGAEVDSPNDYGAIHSQILTWLKAEWQNLDIKEYRLNAHYRTIVALYYGQGQEQKAISQQLGINQSTVSRTLNKVKTILVDRFLAWSQDHLHMSLQVNDVEAINEAVSHWLWSICQTELGNKEGKP
ncbi:sigma-70 family RNA polymerase sigma factor [Acaryochloris sp. IP29b_bin.137]|uniref:sigma-70 family RNA polymerase sigma factor n=1 Tax=Acaryochloris sp. IP29b_bin.137 TaxID=2969217 RepID=UPI00262945E0|nr:sigma-70 family RNA polymerase sigma factor [Acaryochloris sp. IP29b_bin.137]